MGKALMRLVFFLFTMLVEFGTALAFGFDWFFSVTLVILLNVGVGGIVTAVLLLQRIAR